MLELLGFIGAVAAGIDARKGRAEVVQLNALLRNINEKLRLERNIQRGTTEVVRIALLTCFYVTEHKYEHAKIIFFWKLYKF